MSINSFSSYTAEQHYMHSTSEQTSKTQGPLGSPRSTGFFTLILRHFMSFSSIFSLVYSSVFWRLTDGLFQENE